MGVDLEFTDELAVILVASSFSDQSSFDHGSATWEIIAPEFISTDFVHGVLTLESTLVNSFHLMGEEDRMMRLAVYHAVASYRNMCNAGVMSGHAQYVLPRTVRCRFTLSMTLRELADHLVRFDNHSEPLQAIDGGLFATLEESAPGLASRIRPSLPEGVFSPPSDQETVAEQQEAQHV